MEKGGHQCRSVAIIGQHNVGPGSNELGPFQRIHAAGAIVVFIGGKRDGQSAKLPGVEYFDRPIPKTDQILAVKVLPGQNSLQHCPLGEPGRGRRTAENPAFKVMGQVREEFRSPL